VLFGGDVSYISPQSIVWVLFGGDVSWAAVWTTSRTKELFSVSSSTSSIISSVITSRVWTTGSTGLLYQWYT